MRHIQDDARFVNTYWKSIPGKLGYSTFDWGIRDEDGYCFILGRTDDVINVAVVGVADALNRRAIQAVCAGPDAGDLTTMDDPAALQQIRDRVAG